MKRNLMNELTEGIGALAMARQAADKIESLQKQLDESITMAEMLAATINQYKQLDDEQRATIKKLQNELDILRK